MNHPEVDAVFAEFRRLGLDPEQLPGLATGPGGLEDLLNHLRSLTPGASWHEAIPELPKHWLPGKPETWTTPYRPYGPFDHQQLPTGPAVHIYWEQPGQPDRLDRLVTEARDAGWPVFGAGVMVWSSASPEVHAMIILDAGTEDDTLDEFAFEWLEKHDVKLAGIPRRGDEEYIPDNGAA